MTKIELMETYTSEQLADMVVEKYNRLRSEEKPYGAHYDLGNGRAIRFIGFETGEVENYLKAFENAKKERDCQIAEYRKMIEELKVENAELHCEMQAMNVFPDEIPTEPIKVAEMLITAKGECEPLHIGNDVFKDTYRIFDVLDLRQIAEHLLIYCNHNGEVEE